MGSLLETKQGHRSIATFDQSKSIVWTQVQVKIVQTAERFLRSAATACRASSSVRLCNFSALWFRSPHFRRRHQFIEDHLSLSLFAGDRDFSTHDWAINELGRSNHERVKRVCQRLVEIGVSAWFDETVMRGDINHTVSLI